MRRYAAALHSPRASSAFVCLRCELTLARPRLPVLARPVPRAFSSSTTRCDALDDALPQEPSRPKISENPLGRVRRSKGRAIRETTARLDGTTTLGEDASIIVLEEVGSKTKDENEVASSQPVLAEEQVRLNLADAIADEKPATLDEVVHQLDRLRQKATNQDIDSEEGNYVGQAVFVKLYNLLLRGFTSAQLSHYYSVKKNVEKDRVAHKVTEGMHHLQGRSKRPSGRSEWTPGITQIVKRLPSLAVNRRKKPSYTGKHLLADQIMRDVWRLETLEGLEATGQLELVLKDWQLALLTAGDSETPLDKIGKTRLVKFEISATDKVLRITADKTAAEYAVDDVEQLLQASETLRFHLKPWIPSLKIVRREKQDLIDQLFSKDVLQVVAKLTGAYLQTSTDLVIIRALDKQTAAEALRCLVRLMPLQDTKCIVDNSGASSASAQSFPVNFEKEAVDYKLRNTKLGRWSSPINKDDATLQTSGDLSKRIEHAQERVLKMTSALSEPRRDSRARKTGMSLNRWGNHAESRLKAIFGQLLHPLDDSLAKQPYFAPIVPGISTILGAESNRLGFWTRPSLCYDFVAQPGTSNHATDLPSNCFPRLSIVFRPDSGGQHILQKITLQFGAVKYQVSLPEQSVDISFEFEQSLSLDLGGSFRRNQTVDRWKEHVLQNLQSGERLTAPNIELDIPQWTVDGLGHTAKDQITKVKYLFTGISVHQSVWGEYEGNTMVYSTNQSGKLGAKTGTLSTRFGVGYNSKTIHFDDASKAMKEFVADSFQMAHKISQGAAASQTGMKNPNRRGREDVSPRTESVLDSKDNFITDKAARQDVLPQTMPMYDVHATHVQAEDSDKESLHGTQTPEESSQDLQTSSTSDNVSSFVSSDEPSSSTDHKELAGGAQNQHLATSG